MPLTTALEKDMVSMRQAIARLSSIKLGPTSTPTFGAGTITNNLSVGGDLSVTGNFDIDGTLTLSALDASEFVFTNASKALVSIDVPLAVQYGGSGATTLTDHGILLGSGTGAITPLGVATNGQLPIGSTGNDPQLAIITQTANQVLVANGAGTITLSLPQDYDTGATPTLGNLTLSGTENIGLDLSGGTWANANINLAADPAIQIGGTNYFRNVAATYITAFGFDALGGLPGAITQVQNDGTYNIAIGYRAGYNNDSSGGGNEGSRCVYIGYLAGQGDGGGNSGYENVGIGAHVLKALTTGNLNVGVGYAVLAACTTGLANVAMGSGAGNALTTGSRNFFLGENAGRILLTGDKNVCIGSDTMWSADGAESENVCIGYNAGRNIDGGASDANRNIFIGTQAGGYSTSGKDNIAIGTATMGYGAGSDQDGMHFNTCIGAYAGYSMEGWSQENALIGYYAGFALTTGDSNVFIGYKAGRRQTTNNDLLIIDNQDRSSAANEITNCLMYGVFDATPANQTLRINAALTANNYTAANLLTACATNAGALDFSAASKTLTVEDNAVVSQDYSSDASPTFAGLTLTNAGVIGSNSVVFQPNADSTTFLQVLDADGGTPVLNVDTTNERVGIGTNAPVKEFQIVGDVALGLENIGSGRELSFNTAGGGINKITFREGTVDYFQIKHDGSPLNPGNLLQILCANGSDGVLDETPVTITQGGLIGLGTSTPDTLLHIFAGSAGAIASHALSRFTIEDDTTCAMQFLTPNDDSQYIMFGDPEDDNIGQIVYYHSNVDAEDKFEIKVGGLTSFRILNNNFSFTALDPITKVTISDSDPYLTIHNTTHEDGDGGRESRIIARGEQTGGEQTVLGYLEFAHDGAADDQNGMLRVYINDGNDGTSPTLRTKWGEDGSLKHGDGGVTNYASFAADGELTLTGTAKVTKSRTFTFNYRNITAQGKPTLVNQGVFYGFSLPIYNNDDEELFACRCMDGDWDGSTDPIIYLGGWLDTANTSKKFNLQVSVETADYSSNDVVPATTNDYATETTTGTWAQYTSFKASFTIDASAIGLVAGQPLAIRVRRLAASADEIAGEVVVEGAAMTYVANKLGTAT